MDNIKNDKYYIEKMLKDIRFLIEKTAGITLEDLTANEVLCDSVLFRLIQISENSNKLTPALKECHKAIPWQAIKGMRNRIVHEYGDVELGVVYQTITEDIPLLCEMLEQIV